jgi:hypothetical protein
MEEKKDMAIRCYDQYGPHFRDLYVKDAMGAQCQGVTQIGVFYTNDTGLDGNTFLTGSSNFQVKEIEVFEITD